MANERSTTRTKLREVVGFYVAATALLALVVVVAIAVFSLPDSDQKGQNIVALSTSAFGVIGAIVGAYFGIRTANQAVQQLGSGDGSNP
jgi:uncharacterized membrane protein YfcA